MALPFQLKHQQNRSQTIISPVKVMLSKQSQKETAANPAWWFRKAEKRTLQNFQEMGLWECIVLMFLMETTSNHVRAFMKALRGYWDLHVLIIVVRKTFIRCGSEPLRSTWYTPKDEQRAPLKSYQAPKRRGPVVFQPSIFVGQAVISSFSGEYFGAWFSPVSTCWESNLFPIRGKNVTSQWVLLLMGSEFRWSPATMYKACRT